MDSRDSPSPTADDDGGLLLSATAKESALLFQSGKLADCVHVLNHLLHKKQGDPKVLHNIAIAECFRDGCSDPKKLLEVLLNVTKRSEELAHASGENGEVNNSGNKIIIGSERSDMTAHQFTAANSGRAVYIDEFGTSVAMLNIAIIWFRLHEYARALAILEPLFQNLQAIDETAALHICLLLLDVLLACHDASKSADVFTYLEKAFGVGGMAGQGDNGTSTHQLSTNLVSKSNSALGSSSIPDGSSLDSAASVTASETPLSRTLSEEALEYETMISALDIGGQSMARPVNISSSNDLPRAVVDRSFSSCDLKLKLQLYKVRFLLLTRNLKLAKREVKHAINIARGRDSSMVLLLKAQLEYARGNHRKSIKLLMASSNLAEPGFLSMFNNNLGCIYYQLGKYHTSSVFFSKALASCSSLRKDKPLELSTFSQDKSLLITYNCGVQYLACGKPLLAARCFHKASLIFYNRPLLWLRLAECCLMALEKGLLGANEFPSDRSEVRVHVVGHGKWRQLIVEDGTKRTVHVRSVEMDDSICGNDGQLKLSLSLARQCLLNALHLLKGSESNGLNTALPSHSSMDENDLTEPVSFKNSNHKNTSNIDQKTSTGSVGLGQISSNGDAKEQKGGASQENIQSSLSLYEDIRKRENQTIKQVVLANLAYVELELENPLKALSTARSLLKLPKCSRICIFLGHVYAAEALCFLNRPKEAAEHLSIYFSGVNNVELPYNQEDWEQWRAQRNVDCEEQKGGSGPAKIFTPEDSRGITPLNPEEARGVLYANFAAMHAMQGELEQAQQFATRALSIIGNSPQATLTAVYVSLVVGKSEDALAKLKQFGHTRFLANAPILNKS